MRVFLGLGNVQLFLALLGEVFGQCVGYVLFVKEDVHTFEGCIVRSHAVVLKSGNGVHALFGHVLLCKYGGKLLGAVVAIVEEYDNIAFLDSAVEGAVVDGLDKFVGNIGIIAVLHGVDHIRGLYARALYKQVVGFLDAIPAFVAIHSVKTADDTGNLYRASGAVFLYSLDV